MFHPTKPTCRGPKRTGQLPSTAGPHASPWTWGALKAGPALQRTRTRVRTCPHTWAHTPLTHAYTCLHVQAHRIHRSARTHTHTCAHSLVHAATQKPWKPRRGTTSWLQGRDPTHGVHSSWRSCGQERKGDSIRVSPRAGGQAAQGCPQGWDKDELGRASEAGSCRCRGAGVQGRRGAGRPLPSPASPSQQPTVCLHRSRAQTHTPLFPPCAMAQPPSLCAGCTVAHGEVCHVLTGHRRV